MSTTGGVFWTPENPDVRARGQFTAKVGQRAEVILDGGLAAGVPHTGPPPIPEPKPGDIAGIVQAAASAAVARFRPITIQGRA